MLIFYAVNVLIFAVITLPVSEFHTRCLPLIQVQGNFYGNDNLISVAKLGCNFGFSQILTS